MGWEAAEITVYEYDQGGRLARSVTSRESEWDDEQRAWMRALAQYEAGLCHRCGTELAESTDPLHDPDNPHGTHVYRPSKAMRCHACTALMQAAEAFENPAGPSMAKAPHPQAVQHYVQLKPRAAGKTRPAG
jgi:hypothetical protein